MIDTLEGSVEPSKVVNVLTKELRVGGQLSFVLLLRLLQEGRDVLLHEGELLGGQLLL